MKPCNSRWREELAGHVLGSPVSAALNEHLETCAICSATLREWKTRIGQIDAGVRHMAASEPAAQAASSIMAQVRSQRQNWRLPAWNWRTAILSGLIVAGASFSYEWRAHELRSEAQKALSAGSAIGSWRSPTESLLRFSTDRRLKAPPHFGQYFYPLKGNVPGKE